MTRVAALTLMLHGGITAFIGMGSVTNPTRVAVPAPTWLAWWPGPFGRSWVFDGLHLGAWASVLGGLLWLSAGLMLVAAGAGWLGFTPLAQAWESLATSGALVGLFALTLYFHPFYVIAVVINVALIAPAVSGRLAA